MAGLMEEVAEGDHSCGLSRKVQCQTGRGTSEDADQRIQFLPAALQVRAGYGEVCAVEGSGRDEEGAILFIQELVRKVCSVASRHDRRNGFHGRRRCIDIRALREQGGTQSNEKSEGNGPLKIRKLAEGHKCWPMSAKHFLARKRSAVRSGLESRQAAQVPEFT